MVYFLSPILLLLFLNFLIIFFLVLFFYWADTSLCDYHSSFEGESQKDNEEDKELSRPSSVLALIWSSNMINSLNMALP